MKQTFIKKNSESSKNKLKASKSRGAFHLSRDDKILDRIEPEWIHKTYESLGAQRSSVTKS